MVTKVLVPLDGSKIGESAIPFVKALVSKFKPDVQTEVILFNVVQEHYGRVAYGVQSSVNQMLKEEIEIQKQKALEYLSKISESENSESLKIVPKVSVGNAAVEIVKFAESEKVDFIAMSTHGRSGIGRWAFGSVTDRVLHLETHIPILVIRAR